MSDTHVREFDYTVPAAAAGWQRNSVIIGVIGAIALAVIGVFWHQAFMRGYLVGFMLWLGLSLG